MELVEALHVASVETPVGVLRLASTDAGLAFVELPHHSGRGLGGWLRTRAPGACVVQGFAPNRDAARQILEFLEGKRREFDLELDLRGTAFQLEVWQALREIPYGETLSYQELAQRVRRPGGSRAVGSANAANPLSLVVPCHRVVQKGGKLGGYAGGLELKARLLALERDRPRQGDLL